MESRTPALNILGCDRAAMRFNDRTHDPKAHPQSFRLRSEEMVEDSIAYFFGNTNPVIAHTRANCAVAVPLRSDHDFAAVKRSLPHSIKSIDHEIDQDLLQLNRIGLNRRQIWV